MEALETESLITNVLVKWNPEMLVDLHTTNGTWDLIVEIGTQTLEDLDEVLFAIRRLEGVTRSETNLLLSTRRAARR